MSKFQFKIFWSFIMVCAIAMGNTYAQRFETMVAHKTGITLQETGKKTYVFVPFVGKNAERNHFFDRPMHENITTIVLHDTVGGLISTLNKFSDGKEPKLNAHYVITQEQGQIEGGIVIEMVPPHALAQHAWPSWFDGHDDCNQFSIGIELVGKGFRDHGGKRSFYPYDPKQCHALGLLLQNLVKKYAISPRNILSHSDVSCQRKYDVTIVFPWKTLYEKYGIGMGLDAHEMRPDLIAKKYAPKTTLPEKYDVLFFQNALSSLGYDTRFSFDETISLANKNAQWSNVYQAFYAHFSRNGDANRWRGKPDYNDMFWAWALLSKYF